MGVTPRPRKRNVKKLTSQERWAFLRHRVWWAARITTSVLLVVGSALGSGALYHWIKTTPLLQLHHIDVAGAQRAEEWELRTLAEVKMGTHLFDLPLDEVQARVARHPWVNQVTVRRSFPDRLVVEVHERKAVALLAAGAFYYVDEEGIPFKKVKSGEDMDFPILTGFDVPDGLLRRDARLGQRVIREALGLLTQMESAGLPASQVSEVHVSPSRGFSVFLADGGAEVSLGWEDFEMRIKRLHRLRQEQGVDLSRVAAVDLDLDKGAVVTLLPSRKTRTALAR